MDIYIYRYNYIFIICDMDVYGIYYIIINDMDEYPTSIQS